MKYNIVLLLFIGLVSNSLFAQNTVKMSAVKANDYGVAYSLPKTSIVVTASYKKTTQKAGDFHAYAQRYLSISNAISEDKVSYTLESITATTVGVVDKDKAYVVELKPGSTAPFLTLTREGLLCAINEDYTFPKNEVSKQKVEAEAKLPDPRSFLSEEILRAGSTTKQAELIAKQIYKLRESRNNILTGEADNMPPDGNAYQLVIKQLEEQEKALTALFTGYETVETDIQEFTITPEQNDIENKVLFRFSTKLGFVGANDLSGSPVRLSLINKEPKSTPVLTAKEEQQLEKKFSQGIIYNIPSKGVLSVNYNGKEYWEQEYEIVQFGVQEVLTPKLFENNKQPIKVIFYPELGSIKQIIQ